MEIVNNGRKFTYNREIHLKSHELKQLESIHVWHLDITDNQVKFVLVFS